MPKHALTFKHLVGSVSAQRKAEREKPERTVNELLASSRQTLVREQPPHVVVPEPILAGPDGASIHPAELLRRERHAQQQAARSVAGPAPPRSWRSSRDKVGAVSPVGNGTPAEATPEGLQNAAAFLDESHTARPSLVDVCARLVLGMLRDTSVVSEDGDEEVTLADAVLAGACELDVHLRGLLISTASVSGERLADRQVRALLEYADSSGSDTTASGTQPESQLETPSDASSNGDSEWDTDAVQPLTHLALAMHPNPLPLLRDAPHARLLALTSLDLAYATLPDLDRLVAVLPARLRALGLAGVRSRGGYDGWQRGLALMARKLILLQTLDITGLPIDTQAACSALFQAPTTHLPSLRALGLRGELQSERKAIRALVNRGRAGRWISIAF